MSCVVMGRSTLAWAEAQLPVAAGSGSQYPLPARRLQKAVRKKAMRPLSPLAPLPGVQGRGESMRRPLLGDVSEDPSQVGVAGEEHLAVLEAELVGQRLEDFRPGQELFRRERLL